MAPPETPHTYRELWVSVELGDVSVWQSLSCFRIISKAVYVCTCVYT